MKCCTAQLAASDPYVLRYVCVFKVIMHESTHPDEHAPEPSADRDDQERPKEHGGRKGPEPTRFGDWEKNGRCIDF